MDQFIVYVETKPDHWPQMEVFESQRAAESWARKCWQHCNRQVERHINSTFYSVTLALKAGEQ